MLLATTPVVPEFSRERDAGAETEVENDGRLALGQSLRRRQAGGGAAWPSGGGEGLMEDVEMEDANPLPALPEDLW